MFSEFDLPISIASSPMMEERSIIYFISELFPTMLSCMMEFWMIAPSDMETFGPMMEFSTFAFFPIDTGSMMMALLNPLSEILCSASSIRFTSSSDCGRPQSYQLLTSNVL